MGKPTPLQLEKINQFALKQLSEDEVYVLEPLIIDDQEITVYHEKIHENLLRKFVQDLDTGIALLMNHNYRLLPVGRSFDARLVDEYDNKLQENVKSIYADYYIDLGRKTESNMTTDDIVKGIDAGTIFDVSIGFNAESWKCSICGNDIRDFFSCPHMPGKKYAVNRNGEDVVEKCIVIVGEDGQGELLETSLVYAGACDRATITRNILANNVIYLEKGTKLHLVDNFKNIPLNATIYQFYTKNGSVLFTDTDERTNGAEVLRKRSGEQVELSEITADLKKYGIDVDSIPVEDLSNYLDALTATKTELKNKTEELEDLIVEFKKVSDELEGVKAELSKKDEIIAELTVLNEQLSEKAGLAETYRKDLIDKALEFGVRAHGNSFNTELFEKFLNTLSVDEIKDVINSFDVEVKAKFEGARISRSSDRSLKNRLGADPKFRDDFETEDDFRAFVAEKAIEYSKANDVSITEATKLMYKKYSTDGSEN